MRKAVSNPISSSLMEGVDKPQRRGGRQTVGAVSGFAGSSSAERRIIVCTALNLSPYLEDLL